MPLPRVSIQIVTLNRAKLLDQAMASIDAQTFRDFEVVLVNDGSTDETENVVKKWQQKFLVTYIHHPKNLGLAKSRQDSLDSSRGEYIAVLDDDDLWLLPDKLEKQVAFLDSHPEVVLLGSYARMLNMKDGTTSIWQPPLSDQDIRGQMLMRSCFMNPTVIFRTRVAREAGGYDYGLFYDEEYALWLRMGKLGQFLNQAEVTTQFRIANQGWTETQNLNQIRTAITLAIRHRKDYPHAGKALLKWLVQYAVTKFFGVRGWIAVKKLAGF